MMIVVCPEDTKYDLPFFQEHTFYVNGKYPEKLISINRRRAVVQQNVFVRWEGDTAGVDFEWNVDTVLKSKQKREGMVLSRTEYLQPFPVAVMVVESAIWKQTIPPASYFPFLPSSLPSLPTMQSIPILPQVIETGLEGVYRVAKLANVRIAHTELPIPNCHDPEFLQFIELLKDPKSMGLCSQIQKYSMQFQDVSFNDPKSKLDTVAKRLFSILEDFEGRLRKEDHVDPAFLNEHIDGFESYLISLHYDRIFSRKLRLEYDHDLSFSRRLILLDLYQYKMELNDLSSGLVQKSLDLLLEFEEASTPIRKLDILSVFFNLVSDHVKKMRNDAPDADQFISIIIYLIIKSFLFYVGSNQQN
jgi:hypothetical protein